MKIEMCRDFKDEWLVCVKALTKTIQDKNIINRLKNLKVFYDEKTNILTIESKRSTLNLVEHYKIEITEILKKLLSKNVIIQTQTFIKEYVESFKEETEIIKNKSIGLIPHFRFNNFIKGFSNNEAYVAINKFIKQNYLRYSPLLIFGKNGLGKTHLLHAGGNELDSQGYNIIFLPIIDLLKLQNKQIVTKSKKTLIQEDLSQFDVLIVDDIQLLEGKKGAISIFFDLLDSFLKMKKRVFLVADKKPSSLTFLDDRILSRLHSGLIVKINELDINTAINIVKNKKQIYCPSLQLNDSIINFIAENFSFDVRAIEGALNRLDFFFISMYNNKISGDISLETARFALKNLISEKNGALAIQSIIQLICEDYDIPQNILISKSRKRKVVEARHIAIYLLRNLCKVPYSQIGRVMGDRDASTIIFAYKKIISYLKNKKKNSEKIRFLEKIGGEILLKI